MGICLSTLSAKVVKCRVEETVSDNPNGDGYLVVNYQPPSPDPEVEVHVLVCRMPGPNKCVWPSGTPCGGISKQFVSDDLEISDDNGNILPVNGAGINVAVNNLYSNGIQQGTIILGGCVRVVFQFLKIMVLSAVK